MLKWIVIIAAAAFCGFEIFSLVRDLIRKKKKKKEKEVPENEKGDKNS